MNTIIALLLVMAPGDIYLTRNAGGEEANPSPGYWNHAAIELEDGSILEMQSWGNGMVYSQDADKFLMRYPEVLVVRPFSAPVRLEAARAAAKLRDHRYQAIPAARLWREWNCVSLVKHSYRKATNKRIAAIKPDHILLWLPNETIPLKK